jgi:hypothetical protein
MIYGKGLFPSIGELYTKDYLSPCRLISELVISQLIRIGLLADHCLTHSIKIRILVGGTYVLTLIYKVATCHLHYLIQGYGRSLHQNNSSNYLKLTFCLFFVDLKSKCLIN